VVSSCETVFKEKLSDDDIYSGTIDADRFVLWVKTCLVPVLGNHAFGEPRSVVIMDNASIHCDWRVANLIEASAAGARVVKLPPYTPDYNPIEKAFHISCVA
jgi:transposase